MQKSLAFLLGAVAFLSFNQAYAQSSHDETYGADADWTHGGNDFTFGTPDNRFKIRFRGHLQQDNQFYYEPKKETKGIDITLSRARFSFLGSAFDPRLTYLFQSGWEKTERNNNPANYTAPGVDFLRDYYFNFAYVGDVFQVRVGKFRTPFSRQQLISTSQMQFYDQRISNNAFQVTDTGRDVGIMAHNTFNKPYEWALALVSNGIVGRVGINYNNIDGYEFTDWQGTDLRFAVAANGFWHTKFTRMETTDFRAGADFIIKYRGLSTNGAFFYQYFKQKGDNQGANSIGAGVDIGYLINKKYEPVARYSIYRLGGDVAETAHEILAGFNYYIYGHHLKVQSYAGTNLTKTEIGRWLGGVQFQFAI